MSGEALYERYKDALRRGHVASLRGRLEDALTAYAEAAAIAPERGTPHTSAGTALLRARRPAEALRSYEVALRLAPRDEAALLGRAQALAALARRPEAADAFDAVADVRAGAGRLADAVDAARRGLELAEGRDRRRTLERLIERLRASEPGEPGRAALERALQVLEGRALPDQRLRARQAGAARGAEGSLPGPGAEPAPSAREEPSPPPRIPGALDRELAEPIDLPGLAALAEAALDDGAPEAAVERLLDLAAANRRAGRTDAALDACYLALSADPDHVGLHLALVQLYDDRGWAGLAGEKLSLLERLSALDGDREAAARVEAARAGRG